MRNYDGLFMDDGSIMIHKLYSYGRWTMEYIMINCNNA
jgi:hypothetical protein